MKIQSVYLWVMAILLLIGLACLVYPGIYTRFIADDFCMAGDALHLGLADMLVKWYTTWTGRFMFILGTGLLGLGGPKLAGWLVPLAVLIWLAGLAWAFHPIFKRFGWPRPGLLALCTAGLTLFVLFSSTPNLFQSLYWQDGLVNYSLPLIGFVWCCGLLLRAGLGQVHRPSAGVVVFVLAFLCGGFTEAFSALQVSLFILALIVTLVFVDLPTRRRLIPLLTAALMGGVSALLIVLIAPGNQVRLQAVGENVTHPGLVQIIIFSIRNMTHILGKFFIQTPFWALVSILPPILVGWLLTPPLNGIAPGWRLSSLWKHSWLKGLILISGSALILVTAACAPVVYAMNAYPDDRTILVPQFVVVLSVISASALLGIGLRQQGLLHKIGENKTAYQVILVSILLVLVSATGITLWQTIKQVPEYQAYAQTWDEKDIALRQAARSGQNEITVTGGYGRFDLSDLNTDPDNWVNRCMANYYQVPLVRGR